MVSTRSKRLADVQTAASLMPPKDTRRFTTVGSLISFVEVAIVKPEYGIAVTHLTVELRVSSLQRDAVERYLPACLALTPNVVILELSITPPSSNMSFTRVPLPSLEVLKSNLPHRVLASFVALKPTLCALDMSACGRARTCPFAAVSLDHVTDIRCTMACAPAIVHGDVERLRLDLSSSVKLASVTITTLPVVAGRLYMLTVDFTRDDDSILRSIAASMPQLRDLKLLEKAIPSAHRHASRPWKDRTRWSSALRKLTHLEQLVIRTGGSLGTTAGDRDAERDIFLRWVGINQPHASLRYIMVWQHAHLVDGGILSEWSRVDGIWEGKWTVGPEPGQVALLS